MKILLRLLFTMVPAVVFASSPTAESNPASGHNPGTPIATAPASIPYSGQSDAQLQSTYQQYKTLKAQLLEERREAIVEASQQTDPNARLKIMATLLANQKARWQRLQQMKAQVFPLEEQEQAAARSLKLRKGK